MKLTRAAVIIVGVAVSLVSLYLAADWEIARELLGRGYARAGPYWEPARGMGLSWGAMLAAPGVLTYIAIVVWAAGRVPILSATRLALTQFLATLLTFLALHVFGSFGILFGAPLAGALCYRLVRSRTSSTRVAAV